MMLPPGRPFMPVGQPGGLPMMPGTLPQPGLPGMQPQMAMPGLAPAPGLPMGGNNLAPMPSTGMPMPSTMPRPMGLAPPMGGTTLPPPTGPTGPMGTGPRPMMPMMDASMPRPMGPSVVIPPPAPQGMRPQMIPAPQPFPAMPPRPPPGSLPQQLAQLQAAGQEAHRQAPPPPVPFQGEKKPQLFMLIAQLSPHVQESHMQQLLEQCGDLQAFRRAQDAEGKPMSFGVAQFADPESAWKAVTCLSKQRIGGQEIKVLLEENTEHFILKWKTSQKAVFRVSSDEDLEWELERKAVSCKALVDGKLEELFGAEGTGAAQQRRQELRAREDKRVERARKRKAWREAEYSEELERVEVSELGLREAERKRDEEDREKEEQELQEKQRKEQKLEKLEAQHGVVRSADVAQLAENRALMELVHKVQEEPREELFTMKLDTAYLRNERILERKLRPWLERKIDLHMGGQASDLVELIIRRVNGAAQPDPLIAELERFLDEFAEPLVERLWRMLALEMIQNGVALPSVAKRQKKEETLKMAARLSFLVLLYLAVFSQFIAAQTGRSFDKFLKSDHTNNWAVLVCTSRFWFNYRHVANVLSMYRSVKRLGIPDSHIIVMLADDMACNARNPRPGTVFNNANQHINVYGDDIEVDYRGYEVTVENFIRILTGRLPSRVPRSKRLLSDERSNILVYMTGHGGDGFLKFQDAEEITSIELADAFEQMWQKRRYNEVFLIVDTCQAYSMTQKLYSPNILAVGSSLVGEDSLSHHEDPAIGVHVIDRYTYYVLQFLEGVKPNSKATVGELFKYTTPALVISTPGVRTDLFKRDPKKVLVTDFFGSVHSIEMTNSTTFDLVEDTSCRGDRCSGSQSDERHQTSEKRILHEQFPNPQKKQDDKEWHFTTEFLISLMVFMLLVGFAFVR